MHFNYFVLGIRNSPQSLLLRKFSAHVSNAFGWCGDAWRGTQAVHSAAAVSSTLCAAGLFCRSVRQISKSSAGFRPPPLRQRERKGASSAQANDAASTDATQSVPRAMKISARVAAVAASASLCVRTKHTSQSHCEPCTQG